MIARNECRPTLPVENWITLRIVATTCQLSVRRHRRELPNRRHPHIHTAYDFSQSDFVSAV
jgi:hypothetical protein